MGIHINLEDALFALSAAVVERGPDFVYEPVDIGLGCRNWHVDADEPGCIVGLSVHRLGVPAEVMRACETGSVDTLRDDLLPHGVTMTDAAAKVFKIAQVAQDQKAPWGAAVAVATQAVDTFGVVGVDDA